MKLILIRHGITEYNKKRRYCGQTDVALSRAGRAHAAAIGKRLKGLAIDSVFSSDLKRARQTARIVFGKTAVCRPTLREIDFGAWEGLSYEQVIEEYPAAYKKWLEDPFAADVPRGEKMDAFASRVMKELKRIARSAGRRGVVAIVSHAGPIRVILNDILGIKSPDFWKLRIDPGSVFIIEYAPRSKSKVRKL